MRADRRRDAAVDPVEDQPAARGSRTDLCRHFRLHPVVERIHLRADLHLVVGEQDGSGRRHHRTGRGRRLSLGLADGGGAVRFAAGGDHVFVLRRVLCFESDRSGEGIAADGDESSRSQIWPHRAAASGADRGSRHARDVRAVAWGGEDRPANTNTDSRDSTDKTGSAHRRRSRRSRGCGRNSRRSLPRPRDNRRLGENRHLRENHRLGDRRLYDNLATAKSAPKLPRLGQSRKIEAISTNPQAARAPSRLTKLSIAPNTPGATRSQGGHHAPVFDRANLRRSRAHG